MATGTFRGRCFVKCRSFAYTPYARRAMRVLFLYASSFRFRTHHKALESAPDDVRDETALGAALAFVHAEPGDGADQETKLVKNLKWVAGKFESKRCVLHYFAHLGEERLDPEAARALMERARARLASAGYEVLVTPFGHFCDLAMDLPGESMARVYKAF